MKKRYCLLLLLILVLGVSKVYALSENELNNTFTNRIKSIRKTPNTDVSNRNGKIYYVANNGNDSNDGSKDHPWKTIEKVNNAFDNKVIKNGDTVLFNRGDSFRGNINVKSYDILLGSYGNENKPKPEILVSSVNGATKGEWHEVENNIWEYTIDGNIPFNEDVGTIWFFDNNNVKYGIKKTTNADTNEDNINLSSILKKDLEIYQLNHSSARNKNAKNLYVYSESNPKDRFNDIEFALSVNGIGFSKYSDLVVDNLTIKYAGNHGIGGGTVANL